MPATRITRTAPAAPPPARPPRHPRRQRRFATLRAVTALILREMATTYGRSPGGYLWAVLEPVGGIALLTLAFSAVLHTPGLGRNFALYYASGMLPFMAFTAISNKVARALSFSRQLLAYPAVTWLDALLARFLLTALTEFMVAFLVIAGILLAFDTRVIPDWPLVLRAMALAAALGLGVGVLNCHLMTRWPLWQQVWSVLMRPMFLVSGVFFLYETVPEPFRALLWFNPLLHVTGLMRRGFYAGYEAGYVSETYVLALSGLLLLAGLMLLRRSSRFLLQL